MVAGFTLTFIILTDFKVFSLLFSSLILVCCINSQKANYRWSTREEQNNKYTIIATIRLSRNCMTVEKVNTQRQLVTEYISIFGIKIQLN
jgi:hypothetical protein